jgi:inorganic pyrophosphatase
MLPRGNPPHSAAVAALHKTCYSPVDAITGAGDPQMQIDKIPPGVNPPHDINVMIEIPGGAGGGQPVKYEIDKESGAVFVDRIINTPMFYPNNYGFVPNTLHQDGDPTDVMVRTEVTLVPGSVIRCRLVGVLKMEDDGGIDDKLIALPIEAIDPFQAGIKDLDDLPIRHRDRIWHFFEQYKALEAGKWSKILGWGDKAEAEAILMESIERYNRD